MYLGFDDGTSRVHAVPIATDIGEVGPAPDPAWLACMAVSGSKVARVRAACAAINSI